MHVDTPEDFPAAFAKAWMARDGYAIADLFTEDADFVNVVGIWWENKRAIGKAHDYALKSFFSETRLTSGQIKTRRLGTNHAVVHARFRLSGQRSPEGGTAGDRTTILIFVLERHPMGWRAVAAQNTDIVPGAETFQLGETGLKPTDYRD